jgi:hypothetical protein
VVVAVLVFMAAAGSAAAATASVSHAKTSAVLERPAGATPLSAESGATGAALSLTPFDSVTEPRASGTIFYDGSEGATSPWTVQGSPTWAITTYRAAAGTRSSYCAGSAISPPGPYAANMSAWRIAGPFDLSAVSSATLQYKVYLNTENNTDWISSMVSLDGEYFYGWGDSGNSQGWVDRSRDLTAVPTLGSVCGRSQVWIAFRFASDSSVQYEGAYVDEVRVAGGGGSSGLAALSLFAGSRIIAYNGKVTLSGELTDALSGALLSDREIDWWWSQSYEIPMKWTDGGSFSVGTGAYALGIKNIVRRTYFITSFAGDSQYPDGCWSDEFVEVMPRAKITPPAVPSLVRAGKLTTSWGQLLPRHTAEQNRVSHTKVYAERFSGGRWRPVVALYAQAYRNTSSATEYRFGLRYASGKWRVRAVHQDSDHAKTTSSWRTFTVR